MKKLSFKNRINYCSNPTAKRLFEIIADKQTNLCLSADLTETKELLDLVDNLGSEICLLKTHVDILSDFNLNFINNLQILAKKHQFLIFEDRKFADIGHTVKNQYGGGIYHIADWADISNAYILPGPGIIQGLQDIGLTKGRGLLLLAEMSSSGSLARGDYTQANIKLAKDFPEFVIGFITLKQLTQNPGMIHMTPGIRLDKKEDSLGQHYFSPQQAILENRTDIIIVGRGIYQAKNPQTEARQYRELAWEAYLSCC